MISQFFLRERLLIQIYQQAHFGNFLLLYNQRRTHHFLEGPDMDFSQITGFLAVSITLACTPGADWAYIIASAIGPRSYQSAVWGLLTGYVFHTALLVCGIAALVASSPGLLMWLTAAGALYLLWLGIRTLASWKSAAFFPAQDQSIDVPGTPEPAKETPSGSGAVAVAARPVQRTERPFLKGLLTSASNPKALLLYVALIPQFIETGRPWPVAAQTGVLGLEHAAVSLVVYFSIAAAARFLLRSRPLAARIITLCSGIIMIAISLGLLWEQFIA